MTKDKQGDFFKHSFKSKLRENLALTVYNSGFQKCESSYRWGPAVRDHYLIHLVISGKGTYSVSGHTYFLSRGDMFLATESDLVTYTADDENPWEYCWVGFNGTEARRLLSLTPLSRSNPVMHTDENDIEKMQNALMDIYRCTGTTISDELKMIGMLYMFLSMLSEQSQKEQKFHLSVADSYVESACRFIKFNYSHDIDVSDIAKYVGISRSYLYRLFIKVTGISPAEYLSRFRINQACALIRSSQLTMKEISASVGISDQLYFSRVFKKQKGVPPSEYIHSVNQLKK